MTRCKLCTRAAAAEMAVNKERSLTGPMGPNVVFTDTDILGTPMLRDN